jgi:hypothetical protein
LAETQEVLYLQNRSGNRPSHENAAFFFDLAIDQCRKVGFRKIVLRGDTDFSQTEYLDGWNDDGVEFVFGYDATPNLNEKADSLDKSQWNLPSRDASESNHPLSKASYIPVDEILSDARKPASDASTHCAAATPLATETRSRSPDASVPYQRLNNKNDHACSNQKSKLPSRFPPRSRCALRHPEKTHKSSINPRLIEDWFRRS